MNQKGLLATAGSAPQELRREALRAVPAWLETALPRVSTGCNS